MKPISHTKHIIHMHLLHGKWTTISRVGLVSYNFAMIITIATMNEKMKNILFWKLFAIKLSQMLGIYIQLSINGRMDERA